MPSFKPLSAKLNDRTAISADGCHEWTGYTAGTGYGQLTHRMKTFYVHRVAWELANGPIPDEQQVLHRCDNRKCVNPEHLFLGTLDDNMADMTAKRRQAHGPKCYHAKLTVEQVHEIRRSTERQQTIADRYGITNSTVSVIKSGQTWRYV